MNNLLKGFLKGSIRKGRKFGPMRVYPCATARRGTSPLDSNLKASTTNLSIQANKPHRKINFISSQMRLPRELLRKLSHILQPLKLSLFTLLFSSLTRKIVQLHSRFICPALLVTPSNPTQNRENHAVYMPHNWVEEKDFLPLFSKGKQ